MVSALGVDGLRTLRGFSAQCGRPAYTTRFQRYVWTACVHYVVSVLSVDGLRTLQGFSARWRRPVSLSGFSALCGQPVYLSGFSSQCGRAVSLSGFSTQCRQPVYTKRFQCSVHHLLSWGNALTLLNSYLISVWVVSIRLLFANSYTSELDCKAMPL